jgi:hypothetical protein
VRPAVARPLIDEIKDGTLLYAWHPSLAAPVNAVLVPDRDADQ